jgi:N-acyl-D-aspartate/D-glutamate deacylase
MSFRDFCAFNSIPGWGPILDLPLPERLRALADPAIRQKMRDGVRSKDAGVFAGLGRWGEYEIGETFAPENARFRHRITGDVARELGKDPFDAMLDIAIADELRTGLWPLPSDDDEESWKLRVEVWRDERALIGGSDAGAHLDRMCGARYPTEFLGRVVRGRGLVTIEEAVQKMTDAPARFFGLRGRGRIAPGYCADLVLFDPERVDSLPIETRADLPGNTDRLFAGSVGIERVLVNGREIVREGKPTGELPGTVLRSGRDTETVSVPGGAARG